MALMRFSDFNIYCLIYILHLLLCLWFSVIIRMLFICLRILSFMLVLNMLRLIIILYEIGLLRRTFRFILFLLRINLLMFLLSHFLLVFLLLFSSNFGLTLLPQLKRAYYRKLHNIGYIQLGKVDRLTLVFRSLQ